MSVYKDEKRGTYGVKVWVVDADGRRRQIHRRGFARRRDAAAAERQLLVDAQAAPRPGRTAKLRLAAYLVDVWCQPSLAEGVETDDAGYLPAIVPPPLGGQARPGRAGSSYHGGCGAAAWPAGRRGTLAKSRRNIVAVLSKSLTDARRWGLVSVNVAAGARCPSPSGCAEGVDDAKLRGSSNRSAATNSSQCGSSLLRPGAGAPRPSESGGEMSTSTPAQPRSSTRGLSWAARWSRARRRRPPVPERSPSTLEPSPRCDPGARAAAAAPRARATS